LGHFILASSSADEVSVANLGGGAFTQLLLDKVNQLGRERPFERFISFTALAAATTVESPRVLKQRPCWTGISVSEQIAFCQNPYWDPKAPTPDTALSLHELRHVDRTKVADLARSFARSMVDVGTESSWSEVASGAILNAAASDITEESAATLVAAMVESACERTQAYGVEADRDQLFSALEAAVTAIAARRGLDRPEGSLIIFRLAELACRQAEAVDLWQARKGWLQYEDGPATIGIAPIRFWDILGRTCLIAVAADALGMTDDRQRLIELAATVLKANPALWRIEWAGQYPDISLVLGSVVRQDRGLVAEVVRKLLDSYVTSAVSGYRPAAASLEPAELGRQLANKFLSAAVSRHNTAAGLADEGTAMLLFMLSRLVESPLEIDAAIGKLSNQRALGDYCLYEPHTFTAQFVRVMTECTVRHWIRVSLESSSRMLKDFQVLAPCVATPPNVDPVRATLAAAAAGRLFRNRSCFWVFDAMLGRRIAQ
jgi:hypothetical protein